MKKWNAPVVEELNINETAYWLVGKYNDGGYVGDGILSGHSTPIKPSNDNTGNNTNGNNNPENQLS